MTLMFRRAARNFIRKGYFPTDDATLERILGALAPAAGDGPIRLLDPTCGEGSALAEVRQHLGPQRAVACGIEIDADRARHAEGLLDRAIHADLLDCRLGRHGFGLLLVNPPYGDGLADRAGSAGVVRADTPRRLEHRLVQACLGALQPGGVLVLIIPHTSLVRPLTGWLLQGFTRLQVFSAATDRFRQVVVLGTRRRGPRADDGGTLGRQFAAIAAGEVRPPVLPLPWPEDPYRVPASRSLPAIELLRIDPLQLAREVGRHPGLWPQFHALFARTAAAARRPLIPPTPWHLALLLAAGALTGVVRSGDGRVLAVKGDTHKEQTVKVVHEDLPDGATQVVTTRTDRFVPTIRALDLTPGPTLGDVITVR